MRPYFESGNHTLFHGEAFDMLSHAPKCHLLVTDPPYGISYEGRGSLGGIANDSHSDRIAVLDILNRSLRSIHPKRHCYIFGLSRGDVETLPLGGFTDIVWRKGSAGMGVNHCWSNTHEPILFSTYQPSESNRMGGYGNGAARLRRGTVIDVPRLNSRANKNHPTEKPVKLLRQLIESSSLFDELVLDPFVGVGSTMVASAMEERGSVGIEIEERYCEIAANRMREILGCA